MAKSIEMFVRFQDFELKPHSWILITLGSAATDNETLFNCLCWPATKPSLKIFDIVRLVPVPHRFGLWHILEALVLTKLVALYKGELSLRCSTAIGILYSCYYRKPRLSNIFHTDNFQLRSHKRTSNIMQPQPITPISCSDSDTTCGELSPWHGTSIDTILTMFNLLY